MLSEIVDNFSITKNLSNNGIFQSENRTSTQLRSSCFRCSLSLNLWALWYLSINETFFQPPSYIRFVLVVEVCQQGAAPFSTACRGAKKCSDSRNFFEKKIFHQILYNLHGADIFQVRYHR